MMRVLFQNSIGIVQCSHLVDVVPNLEDAENIAASVIYNQLFVALLEWKGCYNDSI